jgi:hypothetical protein
MYRPAMPRHLAKLAASPYLQIKQVRAGLRVIGANACSVVVPAHSPRRRA